ncbi:MAG: cytochrome c [Proteobacteria bacterium]|nr:cytochrome c [Pseudomonadota bacterium]
MTKSSVRNICIGGSGLTLVIFLVLTYLTHASFPERTHPENISEEVVWGKKVWEKHVCIDCHTLLGEGAYYAPELGNVITRLGEEGVREILEITAEHGWGGTRRMPQFDLSEKDIDGLVEFFKWMNNVNASNWPPNKEG